MRILAVPATCLLLLAGCAETVSDRTVSGPGDPNLLLPAGGTWSITAIDGRPLPVPARMKRDNGAVQGSAGCASFSGQFATQGAGLALSGIGPATCPDPTAAQILAALRATDGVSAVSDGSLRLTSGGAERLTLWRVFQPRPGAAARVDTTIDAPAVTPRR